MRPLKTDEHLNQLVTTRLTKTEKEKVKIYTEASGLSISEFLRKKLLGHKVPDKTKIRVLGELMALRNELRKIGGLFKHLYVQDHKYSKETAAALAEQIRCLSVVTGLIDEMGEFLRNDHKESREEKR